MRQARKIAGLSSLAIAVTAFIAVAPPASAEDGRGAGTTAQASPAVEAKLATKKVVSPSARDTIQMPGSYPFQPELNFYRDNPDDAAHTADLMGHPEIAPKLTELMEQSNRVSTQVIGQSTQGRDLYLVTVTAPESASATAQQSAWRDKIRNDPEAAATDSTLLAQYKTPIWISNNIHGNEWEGTDAAMRYIEYLATAPMSEVGSILRNNRIYFSPSLNPDGRTNATRATALGFDPNRDMITLTNPEPASFVKTADAIQAIYAADFHGYTNVLQMEPTGPPHGSNYEYDLYIPHNYALALSVEEHVTSKLIPGNTYLTGRRGSVTSTPTDFIKIPYRDTPSGWDDFPPIFTAQYAAFYGAITATVELPLTRNAPGGRQSPQRAAINTEVAYETMVAIVDYMNDSANARDLLENQIETFRRGVAGEPKTALTSADIADVPGPAQWKAEWDPTDDQEPVQLPRAYVIPVGADQRSASDASRLVQRLLDVGLEVSTLDQAATVGGKTYPKGSYVVDMHQPLRGLANVLLDLGEDISPNLPSMYDISAWSLSYLWGATVDKVGSVTDGPIGSLTRIGEAASNYAMPAAGEYSSFEVAGIADYQALNALLEDGVKVSLLEDGSVVVADADRAAVAAVAAEFDIAVEAASAADLAALTAPSTKGLTDLTIAYVGNQDDRVSLTELGFDDLKQITATNVSAAALADVDVIWVGTAFNPSGAARDAVQAWVNSGGSIVGRTNQAFNAAGSFGLVSGTVVAGNGSGNGIVDVDTPADSVLAPYAQDAAFVYPAYSFVPGEDTKVEQSYAEGSPLMAGHWRSTNATNGPEAAAGKASVVSGEAASGAKALIFGTSVFFRNHPKGGLSQAARGLFWAAPEGARVAPPAPKPPTPPTPPTPPVQTPKVASATGLKVAKIKGTRKAALTIRVRAGRTTPTGKVLIKRNGKTLRTITMTLRVKGSRTIKVKLGKGKNNLRAVYQGNAKVKSSRSVKRVVRYK